eukprot:m51a1_g3689 hypothetical protein (468) ;mRNA; r:341989-343643
MATIEIVNPRSAQEVVITQLPPVDAPTSVGLPAGLSRPPTSSSGGDRKKDSNRGGVRRSETYESRSIVGQSRENVGSVSFYDRAAHNHPRPATGIETGLLGPVLELDSDLIARAVSSPETMVLWLGIGLYVLNALATFVVGLVFIVQSLTTNNSADKYTSLAREIKWKVIIAVTMCVEVIAITLWILEIWIQLSRKTSNVPNAKLIGARSLWGCLSGSTSTVIMLVLTVLHMAVTIIGIWQPILLPVSVGLFCPPVLFLCTTSFILGPVNAAASAVAYNADGFLTPVSSIDVEADLMKTKAQPKTATEFIRFDDVRDIQLGVSLTRFSFCARKNQSGKRTLFKRASWHQRLFFLILTLGNQKPSPSPSKGPGGEQLPSPPQAETEGPQPTQLPKMVGFLLAPQSSIICVRPHSFYGVGREEMRELLGMLTRRVPATETAATAIMESIERHQDEFVIKHMYGAAFGCC